MVVLQALLELNASHNTLTSMLPLASVTNLLELRLAGNQIKMIEGLELLTRLQRCAFSSVLFVRSFSVS